MVRWIIGLVMLNLLGWMIDGVLCAGGGFAVTTLTSDISAGATTIPVASTSGFLNADSLSPAYVVIDDEVIMYRGKSATEFTGCTRGASDPQSGRTTTAKAHREGAKVRTLEVEVVDSLVGYNIVSSSETFGWLEGMWFLGRFFWNLPKLLTWDFVFLRGPLVIVRYLLIAISAGLVVGLILSIRRQG